MSSVAFRSSKVVITGASLTFVTANSVKLLQSSPPWPSDTVTLTQNVLPAWVLFGVPLITPVVEFMVSHVALVLSAQVSVSEVGSMSKPS